MPYKLVKKGSILTDDNGRKYEVYDIRNMVHTIVIPNPEDDDYGSHVGVDFSMQEAQDMLWKENANA